MRVQTLKGAVFELRAQCQYGHERKDMLEDHMHKRFFCDECGQTTSPERIYLEVPEEYRPQMDTVASVLQELMDYEVVGVIDESGELRIEYPKRGIENG